MASLKVDSQLKVFGFEKFFSFSTCHLFQRGGMRREAEDLSQNIKITLSYTILYHLMTSISTYLRNRGPEGGEEGRG